MAFTQYRSKQPLEASGSSGSGSKAGGKAELSTDGDATAVTLTASVEAQIAAIISAWDQKTDEEKEVWGAELFGNEGPPWEGEVAYDDEGDIEYEEKMAEGWRNR